MSIIYDSGVLSLIVQIMTGTFDIYVLSLPHDPSLSFIKNLLWIELWVQIVEGIFYVWLVMNFAKITNITRYRYYDWVITTPTMLFTYCMYLYYIHTKDNRSFYTIIDANLWNLIPIFVLNTLMLFFGYLGETGRMSILISTFLGFIPFLLFFYLIYDTYAKYTYIGKVTFVYFISIWALYGFAALFTYKFKNAMYNILDLFAKNFFGIFLAGVLLYNK